MKTTLSHSKIKTAKGCSLKYHTSYILKIPQRGNSGSLRGDCVHLILETLTPERRKLYVERILLTRDVFCIKSVKRLTLKRAKQNRVDDPENLQKIKEYILCGLSYDFYGLKRGVPTFSFTEKDFLLHEGKKYKLRGFIDRLFVYGDYAVIRDYKTNKEPFKGVDISDPHQALCYALAVKEMFPEIKRIDVEFLFLGFDCGVDSEWETGIYQGKVTKKEYHNGGGRVLIENIDFDELKGFEYELESDQEYLDKFTEKDAEKNLAYHKGIPNDGTFSGALLCGFATKKGELKKDGATKFACEVKFAIDYYLITKDDEFVTSCFAEDLKEFEKKFPPKEFSYENKRYGGCAAHQRNA